ncbi:FecR family protein [Pedobacter gandavensis]|uniref:FecR family protein n=1 Tax=Pedobacter gandavensis TaxID=2679963 RepID=UPI002931292D|nr:FecR domain-containing protein [Pedobacter gandavensis]
MKDHISNEFYRLLNNQCSETELEDFLRKINEEQYQEIYGQLIWDNLAAEVHPNELDASLQKRLDQRLEFILATEQNIESKQSIRSRIFKVPQKYRMFKYAIAASVLLTVSVALVFFGNKNALVSVNPVAAKLPVPGGNEAILTLSDGTRLFLNDIKNGNLALESGISIVKTKDGELIYQALKDSETGPVSGQNSDKEAPLEYNVLETPKGGQYQIVLPDGTKVWLNAASYLKFPASFANHKKREVELRGEAYFEVVKDKFKPFSVMATAAAGLKETVEVLGTHFNISSYPDESKLKTTLLEGSVRIGTSGTQVLFPGQQSVRSNSGLRIKEIDVEEVIAWKNGFFVFENDNLEGILKKLSRWYDVDIDYDGRLNHVQVTGEVSRNTDLMEVLRMLEKTDKFKFKVQGRRVSVMP